jgi:hypothetical protein
MTSEVSPQFIGEGIEVGIAILRANLGVDEEAARQIGMVEMRGPDARCGTMAVAEFFASDHGRERGSESLAMIREDLTSGVTAEAALMDTFGRAAFTRDEQGRLKTRELDHPTHETPQPAEPEKK